MVRGQIESYWKSTTTLRQAMRDDFRLIKGGNDMWKSEDIASLVQENRPVVSFNIPFSLVNFLCGYQQERAQDPRYFPRGMEDEALGRHATSLAKYAMDVGQGRDQLSRGFRKGAIGGMGILELCHSTDLCDDILEGEVSFDILDPLSFYCDRFARRYDRNDGAYMGKMFWPFPGMPEQRWPQHAAYFEKASQSDYLDQLDPLTTLDPDLLREFYDKDTRRPRVIEHFYRKPIKAVVIFNKMAQPGEDAYLRVKDEQEAEEFLKAKRDAYGQRALAQFQIQRTDADVGLVGPTGVQHFTKEEDAEDARTKIKKQAGAVAASQYEIIKKPTTALRVMHLTAWELLDDLPSPYGSDWRFPWALFTPYQDMDDYSSIKGIVRDLVDIARECNWHYATLLDIVVRGPKSPIFFAKAENADLAKIKAEIHRAGYVGEFSSAPPVILQTEPAIQTYLALISQGIQMQMNITGITAEILGQTTQKTVSGRAIQARQSGALVGVGSLMMNWQATQRYAFELLVRRMQQYYSVEKMQRIIGQQTAQANVMGLSMSIPVKPDVVYEKLKMLQQIDFDVVVDFQEASPTARSATFKQMVELKALGAPYTIEQLVMASDAPFKEELMATIKQQGEQPMNPDMMKMVSALQGNSSGPDGVNKG